MPYSVDGAARENNLYLIDNAKDRDYSPVLSLRDAQLFP
jgi:hypothetical protein